MSDSTELSSTFLVEEAEQPGAIKNAAVDLAGFLEAYSLFRNEYDKPQDRIPELNRVVGSHPVFSDRIMHLDAQIERALELEKDFIVDLMPVPTQPEEENGVAAKRKQDVLSIPPDYTFSGVRSPVARRLLNILNIGLLTDEQAKSPRSRPNILRSNGERLRLDFFGNDSYRVLRARTVDILEAILSGRMIINASPKPPESALASNKKEDQV